MCGWTKIATRQVLFIVVGVEGGGSDGSAVGKAQVDDGRGGWLSQPWER